MPLIAIIIPCFNEQDRLAPGGVTTFLRQHPQYYFVFVDDGSTDKTGQIIDALKIDNQHRVEKIEINSNKGKANAVREGFLFSLAQKKYSFLGYWDADMSTSFDELLRMTLITTEQNLDFAFGSRMKKLNASIERSGFRHFAGRMIATLIDTRFNLGIYDTQCGAKLFTAALAENIFKEPFVTEWLFDVEIFLRIRAQSPSAVGEEISLKKWVSRKGSKITIFNSPGLILQLIRLSKAYRGKEGNDV